MATSKPSQGQADSMGLDQMEYWNGPAGERWASLQERMDRALEPFGRRAIERLAPSAGARVLDVGCGCGATTLALGALVGPSGRAVGIDLSQPMLAKAAARAAGQSYVRFVCGDASVQRFDEPFDAAFSRFGVMFFRDPAAAFRNLHRALRPGGSLVFACWRPFELNEWLALPVVAVERMAPATPVNRLQDAGPGPFSFADPSKVTEVLVAAGFDRIDIQPYDAPVVLSAHGLDEAIDFAVSAGPVGRWFAEAGADERERARRAIREALGAHLEPGGVRLGGAAWIVSARRP